MGKVWGFRHPLVGLESVLLKPDLVKGVLAPAMAFPVFLNMQHFLFNWNIFFRVYRYLDNVGCMLVETALVALKITLTHHTAPIICRDLQAVK